MNEDRELLELAAFAAGVKYDDEKSKPKDGHAWWGLWLKFDREPSEYDRRYWNPLADDGDALRLANALGFNQYHVRSTAYVEDLDSGVEIREDHRDDINKATRRAIVRAAASIVKQMKEQDK